MLLSKKDFIERYAKENEVTKKVAEEVVDNFIKTLTSALSEGNDVRFIGFGSFYIKTIPQHEGVNPQTGEPMIIEESKRVSFKSGKKLKDSI